ncbi:hypothetical protein VP501E541_P0147 [Vibrio phage 501E54-1]|nr:hypothetical protein VP501E541_P0147 [Vibrio phage 501E54-1]
MLTKFRQLSDSVTKGRSTSDGKFLIDTLTNNQRITIQRILNAKHGNCLLYDYRNGCLYKQKMIPASINDISKAIDKKVDKMFLTLVKKRIIKKVIDLRGREVWMINPDLYWGYVTYELYYNRWLFSTGYHLAASQIVDASLHYGYFYHCDTGEPINKISRYHWSNMIKWWRLRPNG